MADGGAQVGVAATEQPAVQRDRLRLVPWVLWALTVAISIAAIAVVASLIPVSPKPLDVLTQGMGAVWATVAGLLGALITSKQSANRCGWLLVALGLVASYVVFTSTAAQTDHPAAVTLSIVSDLGWVLLVAIFALFILLFPDGRPLSPRWRPVVWFVGLWPPVLALAALILAPHELIADSPTGVSGFASNVLFIVTLIAITASAVLRFARSTGIERQQLKWFAYGTSIGFSLTLVGQLLPVWGGLVSNFGIVGPLAGTAVALFRYRLYDIDELISRTFVYGALVAILAGLYTASIRFFNAVFTGVTGLGDEEWLVITTLILATTFTPIKKRLEAMVEARYKTPDESDGAPGTVPSDLDARLRAIVREEIERARAR